METFLGRMFARTRNGSQGNLDSSIDAGRGLRLEPYARRHFQTWREAREASREFLQPWEPKWRGSDTTLPEFLLRLRNDRLSRKNRSGCSFLLTLPLHGTVRGVVGGINLSNIRFGAARTATLGYWMRREHSGKGYMALAVESLCRNAFQQLELERIEAACLPENAASRRVLEKCGFHEEGYARQYLEINGTRRDHLLYARIADDSVIR